jgi:hypothetical protein
MSFGAVNVDIAQAEENDISRTLSPIRIPSRGRWIFFSRKIDHTNAIDERKDIVPVKEGIIESASASDDGSFSYSDIIR